MDTTVGPEVAVHSTSILKTEQKPLPTVHLLPDAYHPALMLTLLLKYFLFQKRMKFTWDKILFFWKFHPSVCGTPDVELAVHLGPN